MKLLKIFRIIAVLHLSLVLLGKVPVPRPVFDKVLELEHRVVAWFPSWISNKLEDLLYGKTGRRTDE